MDMIAYQPVIVLLPLVQKPVLRLDLASHGRDAHEIREKHHFIQSFATIKRRKKLSSGISQLLRQT